MDYSKAIFVFGSNLSGRHGGGAAKFALNRKGAKLYQAEGLQGQAYAIPTVNHSITGSLEIKLIKQYVNRFIQYAKNHPHKEFQVTRIGCGLAGLKDEDIAELFVEAPDNCWFDSAWEPYLGKEDTHNVRYWGTF